MTHTRWLWTPIAAVTTSAFATTYYTTEQAQQAMFPGEVLTPAFVTLNDAQAAQIARSSGVAVRHKEVQAWKAGNGGWFILDDVIGKHDAITYAVALHPDGRVRQLEILTYRESYGYEVRSPAWRGQFVGKTHADPLELNQDVRNISGATLSCRHIAEGVKRILATHAAALR